MAKKVFIHIGHLKSGSSSIQNFLWDNSHSLQSEGFKYLETGIAKERIIGIRHYHLWRLTASENCLWPDVIKEMNESEQNNFVISYEGLIRLETEKVEYIKKHLVDFDVVIICYLRRQDLFIQSLYAEYVQNHGIGSDFHTFLNGFSYLCDYQTLLTRWMNIFGHSKVVVKNFDKLVSKKISLQKDFVQSLGISLHQDLFRDIAVSNKTLCLEHLREMFKLNCVEKSTSVRRLYAQELLKKIPIDSRRGRFFSSSSIRTFMKNYKIGNQWLCETFESFSDNFSEDYHYSENPDRLQNKVEQSVNERR